MSLTLSGSGTIGGLVAGGLPDATVTAADLAPNAVDTQTLTLLNASGSAPVYACRAWVNFNGTGTVAIRASGNVSSITDNGTGDYTVNFTTAMPDANYSVSITGTVSSGNTAQGSYGIASSGVGSAPTLMSTSAVRIVMGGAYGLGLTADMYTVCVNIIR